MFELRKLIGTIYGYEENRTLGKMAFTVNNIIFCAETEALFFLAASNGKNKLLPVPPLSRQNFKI